MDFSSYDAHQFEELLKITDRHLYAKTFDAMFNKSKMPDKLRKLAKKLMTRTKFGFRVSSRGGKVTYLSGKVNGTVPSGCASITTNGNTERNRAYCEFLLEYSRIINYILKVSGDDSLIVIKKSELDSLLENIPIVLGPN